MLEENICRRDCFYGCIFENDIRDGCYVKMYGVILGMACTDAVHSYFRFASYHISFSQKKFIVQTPPWMDSSLQSYFIHCIH
jgi:hypothetical protein